MLKYNGCQKSHCCNAEIQLYITAVLLIYHSKSKLQEEKNNISETPVGATRLRIVSGYATPGVAEKFLPETLQESFLPEEMQLAVNTLITERIARIKS